MKRFLACLLALMLPLTALASSAEMVNGFGAMLEIAPADGPATTLEAGVTADETGFALHLSTPFLKPCTLQFSLEKGLLIFADGKWHQVEMPPIPQLTQMGLDAGAQVSLDALTQGLEQLMGCLQEDLLKIAPLFMPLAEKVDQIPAVMLLGMKIQGFVEDGKISLSGSDFNAAIQQLGNLVNSYDRDALVKMSDELHLGDLYLQVMDMVTGLFKQVDFSAFSLVANLAGEVNRLDRTRTGYLRFNSPNCQLLMDYTLNEMASLLDVSVSLTLPGADTVFATLSVREMSADLNLYAMGGRVEMTLMQIDEIDAYSLIVSAYGASDMGEVLLGAYTFDVVEMDDNVMIAADTGDGSRSYLLLGELPTGDGFRLSLQDSRYYHEVTLAPEGENALLLTYTQEEAGKTLGVATLMAGMTRVNAPVFNGEADLITLEEALALLGGV